MALIKCSDCNRDISENSASCPGCGSVTHTKKCGLNESGRVSPVKYSKEKASKDVFDKIVVENMSTKSPNNPHKADLIKFIDQFSINNSKKQYSSFAAFQTVGISYLMVMLFGKKRLGYDIYSRNQIKINSLWSAYSNWLNFDINNEIPIMFIDQETIDSDQILLTNIFLYINTRNKNKLAEKGGGKIELSKIYNIKFANKIMSRSSSALVINGEEVCLFNFSQRSDVKLLNKLFLELERSGIKLDK